MFVVAVHVVAPVNFIDFAGGSAGAGDFEITREGKHGDIASFLIEANNHNRISELGAIVDAVSFTAFHIITTSAKGKDIGTTVLVGFKRLIGFTKKAEEVAFTIADSG